MPTYEPGELTLDEARAIYRRKSQDRIAGASEETMQEYNEEAQAQVDDIVNRRQNAKTDAGRLNFGNEAENPAPIADGEQVDPSPGVTGAPKPNMPSTGGMGGFNSTPGGSPNLSDYEPGAGGFGSGAGAGGTGSGLGDYSSGSNLGLDDENPWESAGGYDPDDVSGGLAGLGGGGGLGGGPGGGPGLGGGGGIGGGAGAGVGGGAGAGVGTGGMMGGGAMGGGRGAGAGAGGRGAGGGGRGAGA
ncbi:hypothetical protein, partial [Glycomyces halotolerans]